MVPRGPALHNTVFNEMHRASQKYKFLKKKKGINKNTDFEVSQRKHNNMKCNYAAQKQKPRHVLVCHTSIIVSAEFRVPRCVYECVFEVPMCVCSVDVLCLYIPVFECNALTLQNVMVNVGAVQVLSADHKDLVAGLTTSPHARRLQPWTEPEPQTTT